jgi:hypothetical protein
MDAPTLPVVTKYGTLTMQFEDPTAYRPNTSKRERSVALVTGKLTVRGIQLEIYVRLAYMDFWYNKDGQELPTPVTELRPIPSYTYNRREDRKAWDFQAQYHNNVYELWNTVAREAYEAHPELQAKAIYVRLEQECAEAESEIASLETVLAEAQRKLRIKQQAVAAFLAEHPEL